MKATAVLILAFAMISCSSQPVEYSDTELALLKSQMETPTLMIDCPSGCSFQYRDPAAEVVMPERPTNGWDAVVNATNVVGGVAQSLVVPAAMGYVAVEGFKALKGSGAVTTTTSNTSTVTETTSTTTTTEIDNSVGDNSGDMSGNQGEVYTDNAGMIDSQIDNTSEPTVVPQPAPVIVPVEVVEQPQPIVIPSTP